VRDAGTRRALARLAERSATAVAPRHRATIDRASAAVHDLQRAVSFVESGGLARLEAAVVAAERADARTLSARGRRALRAFERFRTVTSADRARVPNEQSAWGGVQIRTE
jgi:hypothetical protein